MKAQQQQQQQPPNAQLQASVSPRIKIVLGEKPSVTHCNPFYLMSKEPPQEAPLTGASNLIKHHDLEQAYSMYCTRRLREELSCFLPGLPGQIDTNGEQSRELQRLRCLLDTYGLLLGQVNRLRMKCGLEPLQDFRNTGGLNVDIANKCGQIPMGNTGSAVAAAAAFDFMSRHLLGFGAPFLPNFG
uniref:Mediator of RNA polymerase II transcription subunit 19 n=1 Tax=Macrostomum lignano TaxID=282301 RepID=A0A1I8H429_9PLAT